MNRTIINFSLTFMLLLSLSGCAAIGPSVIKTYDNAAERNQVAILRVDKSKGLRIDGCDSVPIQRGAKYILLKPGRHEVFFSISGQTLFETYWMKNKKYLDAVAGHTYILKSKGGGIFLVGDKWFPEVFDVTDDVNLHVGTLPREENIK
ncbi:MAG: hypothetical protein WC676_08490 [Candidatus Omnitrophota bacterium]